ncbi:MAG: hypothetical protein HY787_23465 [Deltaproteobacteria bacterium]|nr:hypothetical protein [Deltaproteobacteria bacterium]
MIEEIPLEEIGTIIEISKNGLKVKKAADFDPEDPILTFPLFGREIKATVRWQDQTFLGLESSTLFNDPGLFHQRIKRAKEIIAPAQRKVHPENAIAQNKRGEELTSMINLLLEVDSAEPNILKIGRYFDEISWLEEMEKTSEKEDGEEEPKSQEGKTLKEELITRARGLLRGDETREIDINFAITILGLSKVGGIIQDHINKKVFQSDPSQSLFENYETFNVLKSVVFKNFCRFFGLLDLQQEGSTLLSLETTGVDLLIRESSGILDNYYNGPSRLYAEFSRMYERTLFEVDPLQLNQYYFERGLKSFGELFNGYILAHHTLNLHYFPSEDQKLSLSKSGLIFSYLAYLTFLAIQFLMDKDRENGFILSKRLKGRGMETGKIDQFLEQSVTDTKTVLRNLKLKGTLSKPSLPDSFIPIENYLGKDIRFEYLVQAFRNFSRGPLKRMALRYEDPAYAHFILGKLMNSESIDLNSKAVCVVPCRNISNDQWYIKDFAYFELLVFKEIHKLPSANLNSFLKLWYTFEGQIIATFSHLELLDYRNSPMYTLFNNCLVDFPSCFSGDNVYGRMIDHTLQYLKPFLGDQTIDRNRYLPGVFTMNHIKADILLNKEKI